MNLKYLLSSLSLIVIFFLSACDKDSPDDGSSNGITAKGEIYLTDNTQQPYNFKAPSKPTITTDASWLRIGEIETKATDIYTTNISAERNPKAEERTAEFVIKAGKHEKIVKVTQKEGDTLEILGVEPSKILQPEGGSITIKFAATRKPAVYAPYWLLFDENFDYTKGELVFTYGAATWEDRDGEINFGVPGVVKSIKIRQNKVEMPNEMGSTATQLAAKMYAGINIGNTMESPEHEGAWTQIVNEEYIGGLAKMGFNAVRIPCAWDSHVSDASTNTIDPFWLLRVDQVISHIIGNGMYAILNIHWDGGWLENSSKDGYDAAVDKKQKEYWTQIANQLNHYDEHLLFAAMNEPNVAEKENGESQEAFETRKANSIKAIMKYQQTMLDAVRATGGNNASRVLVMQAPNTSNEIAVEGIYQLPKDVIADRLMIETHFYGPYQFNMMETDADWGKTFWYWGKDNHVAGSDRNSTWGEEEWVKEQFDLIKKHYTDKGIPGILGEYCVCCNRENTPGIDADKWKASARLWSKTITIEAKRAGMVPFFWETGGDINRSNGTIKNPLQLDGVFEGAAEGAYPF